ncbi:mono/diheme cytochrome c family protein [Nitrosomonas nitrosa]|jgi:mono/diheme cytochrome c family protein|uniref:Cytochrome c, mono-and diheme variants n=1 Tax=Nitrosomonas nitrosa TaxID=52442 RepID=A0A8H8Z030_9PROT|nr:cytochrome c [Nitrosomonas nitrosa]PTQ93920.1 mono/diheme cytochrome c family protein [Nitrosomonas nitrosa]CAE6496751.1 Cytochrome c, mono-and diheme variants [Nitrosomonas nitrosa]HNP52502.1 cytochrome c [Nitrosomonas nitrosa]
MKTALMLVATIKRVFSGTGYGLIALLMVGVMEIHAATESTAVQQLARGEYLARVGNCLGCHTTKGGQPFAGGLRLTTSFGTFVTPNITPDDETGIGRWSQEDFWRAMHEGKSRDGRLLYPAFPYTDYTKVTREDADLIFAYLRSIPAVSQSNPPHEIRFPYNYRPLLYVWRALFFKQGIYEPDSTKSEEWNRGAYLVQGLGHCNACHTARNVLGASQDEHASEGQIMDSNWYAPSLTTRQEAGSMDWSIEEIVELLTVGVTQRAMMSGPMGTVVRQSLQYLTPEDARAMAVYLKSLPESDAPPEVRYPEMPEGVRKYLAQGEKLYEKHCQDCHGASGQGAPGIYPALAGNRSVTMAIPTNVIRIVLNGGYPPTTAANPQPYGMPPFQQIIRDEEVAQLVSFIRNAWGNRGSLVTPVDVGQSRGSRH